MRLTWETQRSYQLSHRGDASEGNLDTFDDSIANSNPSVIYRYIHSAQETKKNIAAISVFSCFTAAGAIPRADSLQRILSAPII